MQIKVKTGSVEQEMTRQGRLLRYKIAVVQTVGGARGSKREVSRLYERRHEAPCPRDSLVFACVNQAHKDVQGRATRVEGTHPLSRQKSLVSYMLGRETLLYFLFLGLL